MPQKEVCHGGSRSALNVKCNLLSIPTATAHWSINAGLTLQERWTRPERNKTEKGTPSGVPFCNAIC